MIVPVLLLAALAVAFADPFNTPPIFLSPAEGPIAALTEKSFELDIEVEDIDNDILKVTVENLPAWCHFDPYLMQLYGTPGRSDRGEHHLTIKADDGREVRHRKISLQVSYGHSIQQQLQETMQDVWKTDLPQLRGASAAVVGADGQLSTVTIGHSDAEKREALDASHRFRVASVSKLFTATLILRLAEQGRLGLDDRLADHMQVPGLPFGEEITIRQLLSHTAGVIDHLNHPSFYRGDWKHRKWSERDIYRFAAVRKARFRPGEGYAYSNTGYYLLGKLAEKILGKPLKECFAEEVFQPAGLVQTEYDDYSDRRHRIDSLADNGRGYEYHQSAVGAAGAIISTPSDVARFGHALFHGQLLGERSLKAMQQDLGFEKGGDHYGLGMRLWDDYGIRHIGHTGALMGYRSILMYLPEQDVTVAISTHHSHRRWYNLVNGVLLSVADYYE